MPVSQGKIRVHSMYGDGIHLTVAHTKGSGHTASNRITKRYPYRVIWSHHMTTNEKVARRKLNLLELAKKLNNVSTACKLIGYSRQQFYEIRRNYQTYGAEGLLDKLPGCKGAHPNRVAPEIEQAILDYSLTRPTHGPLRVAQELALQGINVSAGGVRGVWQHHDLLSKRRCCPNQAASHDFPSPRWPLHSGLSDR